MALVDLVRYEPATLSLQGHPWVRDTEKSRPFCHDWLEELESLNAYVFPASELPHFLDQSPYCKLFLSLYPLHGVHEANGFITPTTIQMKRTAKQFTQAGWRAEPQANDATVFWLQYTNTVPDGLAIGSFQNPDTLTVLLLSQDLIPETEVPHLVQLLGLVPSRFVRYHPRQETFGLLLRKQLGLVFFSFDAIYNQDEVITYLSWAL